MLQNISAFDIIKTLVETLLALFIFYLRSTQSDITKRLDELEENDDKYMRKADHERQRSEDRNTFDDFKKEIKLELRDLAREVHSLPAVLAKIIRDEK